MHKKNYFRKSPLGFSKWCRLIKESQILVREFRRYPIEIRDNLRIEYTEARMVVEQYQVLKSMLVDEQIELLDRYYITNKIAPTVLYVYKKDLIDKWLEVVFPNDETRLKELDTFKLAKTLEELRKTLEYSKEEIAELIGVLPATLRAYERGVNLIPVNKLFLLCQIYDVSIADILSIK